MGSKQAAEGGDERIERFVRELSQVGGAASVLDPEGAPSRIAALLKERKAQKVMLDPGSLPRELPLKALRDRLTEEGFEVLEGFGEDVSALRDAAAGVTGALAAVADSGTLLLGGAPRGGWQWASLLPPLHIAVIRADQIRPTLDEALRALREHSQEGGEEFVWITGPSRTADIAITLLLGMHGPRELHAVILS